jgi:hypothetical protein
LTPGERAIVPSQRVEIDGQAHARELGIDACAVFGQI